MSTARKSRSRFRRVLAVGFKTILATGMIAGILAAPGIVAAQRVDGPELSDWSAWTSALAALVPAQPAQQAPQPAVAAGADEQEQDPPEAAAPPQAFTPATESDTATAGQTTWQRRGSPHRMVTVRPTTLDVVSDGQIVRRSIRSGSVVTLAELDRLLPASWLTISNGTAMLNASVVLTRDTTLDIGGDVRTLKLTGGATPADASSIHTGGGKLALNGVAVTSVDPATGQPVAAGAAGRPSIVASTGGRLDGADTTISDLGTAHTSTVQGRAAVVFNPGSTGSLARTTLQGGNIGLQLQRSNGVRLADVTVNASTGDGLVLSGDRGTTMSGIRATGNTGNGVQITGQNSDRPITGITTSANGEYGLAVDGQTGTQITGITTSADKSGGMNIGNSHNLVVTDFTATDQRVGVFAHVFSTGLVLDRVSTTGGRWGVSIEKTTQGVTVKDSTFRNAGIAGVTIGGQQVALDGVQVRDSQTGVRVERGANDARITNLAISGNRDGVVTMPGTTGVNVTGLVADNVQYNAVRSASPGAQIIGARINGATTGITADAATTITDTTISGANQGIRSRSAEPVQAKGVKIDTASVGINAADGSPFVLTDSHVHALQSVRGEINSQGINDLSLPPLSVISVVGLPLIVLAIVLEEIHTLRQRRDGNRPARRRAPPLRISRVRTT